ncbi:MAG: hypothetical protein HQL29_05890, partial [Candidatus Omnitrophica bacterium]|nr:hypothetical protein [Candidatus Omnitrophota bacterium]
VIFINAGLHVDERNKKDSIDKFIERVLYLQDRSFNIDVGYLVYPELFDGMEKDIKYLQSNGVKIVNAKTFRGYYKGKKYPLGFTAEEKELIAKYTLDPRELEIVSDEFNLFGKMCLTGKKYFRLDPAGKIFRCSSSFKCYGNLFKNKYEFDKVAKPCPLTCCGCPYEGLKYVVAGKASLLKICKEVLNEIKWSGERGFTFRKLKRYIEKKIR